MPPGHPNNDFKFERHADDPTKAIATWTLSSLESVGGLHLLWRAKGTPKWQVAQLNAGATSYQLAGLDPSADYEGKVESFDYAGSSNTAALLRIPPPSEPPPGHGTRVGTNGATGWGPVYAKDVLAGIPHERLTFQPESLLGENCATPDQSKALGFTHNCVVIGNVNDGTPLHAVNQATYVPNCVRQAQAAQAAGNCDFASLGNEMQLKGGVEDPVLYGKMYVAVKHAMTAAGLTIPLAFGLWGHGWCGQAVSQSPELQDLIEQLDGHYYGWEGLGGGWGPADLLSQRDEAHAARIKNFDKINVTECGCELNGTKGRSANTTSQEGQAHAITSALNFFIRESVLSAYVYIIHDDGTGNWGSVDTPSSPSVHEFKRRQSFDAVATAVKAGG